MSMVASFPVAELVKDRPAVLFLLVSVLCCVGAVAHARSEIESHERSYRLAYARAANHTNTTRQYSEQLSFWHRYKDTYSRWLAEGKVGNVDRMDWVELLLDASAGVGALDFNYQLGSGESVEALFGRPVQHSHIYISQIELECVLKHGADLFAFFEHINQQSPGSFVLSELKLEHLFPSSRTSVQNAAFESGAEPDKSMDGWRLEYDGVKVNATLSWITVNADNHLKDI